jgi:hypothetical protein
MECDRGVSLLKPGGRVIITFGNMFIITEDISSPTSRDSHRSQFAPKSLNEICSHFQGNMCSFLNVLDFTVFCLLLHQVVGTWFTKMAMLACYRQVT